MRGDDTFWGEVIGIGPPLVDLHQSRLDRLKLAEEPGYLVAGAQRLRCGDMLVVDALTVDCAGWMSMAGWEIAR